MRRNKTIKETKRDVTIQKRTQYETRQDKRGDKMRQNKTKAKTQ